MGSVQWETMTGLGPLLWPLSTDTTHPCLWPPPSDGEAEGEGVGGGGDRDRGLVREKSRHDAQGLGGPQ